MKTILAMKKLMIMTMAALAACACEARTIKDHGLKLRVVSQAGRRASLKEAAVDAIVNREWKAMPDDAKNGLKEVDWKSRRKHDIMFGWKETYDAEAAERHAQKAILLKKTTTTYWYYVPAGAPQTGASKPASRPKAKKQAKEVEVDVMAELPEEVKEFFKNTETIVVK